MKYFTTAMFGLALMTSAAVAAPSMVTSASLRAKTACDLIKKPDLLAKLTVPENTHVSFRTANGDDILHASWGVSAFIDLNNDGKLDALLHVASMTVPRVETPVFVYPADYPMRGATQYGWSNDFGFNASGLQLSNIESSDLNGDGIQDVLFVDYGEHDFTKYHDLQRGFLRVALSGPLGKYAYTDLNAPKNLYHDAVIADIDGDGDQDIIGVGPSWVNGKNQPWVVVMENDGAGKFTFSKKLSRAEDGAWAIAASDVDGDGKIDLLLGESPQNHNAKLVVYWGGSRDRSAVSLRGSDAVKRITTGDLDGDGKNEILVVSNTFVAGQNADNALNVINRISFDGRTLKKQEPYHKSAQSGGAFSPYDLDICDGKPYWFASATGRYVEIQKNQN